MLNFIDIEIEGFGSIISPIKYNLNQKGITAISGANGAGKSTIFASLVWCLYGQMIKKNSTVLPWDNIKHSSYHGTCVKVRVRKGDITYTFIRCLDYSGEIIHNSGIKGRSNIFILENGEFNSKHKGITQNKKAIELILGYSFELFKNAIIFPQESARLMEEPGPTKKKIFEEAFGAEFISRAKEISELKLKSLKDDTVSVGNNLTLLQGSIENLRDRLQDIKNAEQDFYQDLKESIKEIRDSIAKIDKEFLTMKPDSKKITDIQKRIAMHEDMLIKAKKKLNPKVENEEFKANLALLNKADEVEKNKKTIESLKRQKVFSVKCDACGQPIKKTPEFIRATTKKIKEHQNLRSTLFNEWQKLSADYEVIKESLKSHQKAEIEVRELERVKYKLSGELASLKGAQDKIAQLYREKEKLGIILERTENQKYKKPIKLIKNLLKELNNNETKEKELREQLRIIQNRVSDYNWLITDPLSNSGLKAFIFNSMLKRVNTHLSEYTKYIGFTVKCFIDLASANKNFEITVIKDKYEVSYYDLSKGQKQLTNLALVFSISDSLSESKPANILLLDEVFESLSEDNVEVVGNIIKDKAKNKNIHIITHLANVFSNRRVIMELNAKGQTQINGNKFEVKG